MFLKAFKEKSNRKYINKLLDAPKVAKSCNKIKTIVVLLCLDDYADFEVFRQYFRGLGLTSPKHKVIAFTKDDKFESSQWDTHFSPKDFGWNGKINNVDLKSLIDEPYDCLISYHKKDILELDLITAMSKARFKVGLSKEEERLYDLIIDIKPQEIEVFKKELEKYLNILNKL